MTRTTGRRSLAIAAGLALALAAVAGAVLVSDGSAAPETCAEPLGGDPNDPFGFGGRSMSLDEAERAFGPPVVRPQIDVASDRSIDAVWVKPSPAGQVFIRYGSGIVVNLRPFTRQTWQLARDLTSDGSPGELISVRGKDVFTVPPDPPCFFGNAVFNVGGAHVAVLNEGDEPFGEIRRVTQSILETAPAVIAEDRALDGG
jgi:hypothetical protein